MTFRFEVFVENKHLGDVLETLSHVRGISIPSAPQLVVNRSKSGKPISGSKLEAAAAILDKLPTPFTIPALKIEFKSIGVKDPNYYVQGWKKAKLIKMKERGVWVKLPHKVAS